MHKISTRVVCVNGKHPKTVVNPLNPNIKIQILIYCPYTFRSSGENLLKYQLDSSCVIMSVILMTTLFYKALILQGEIWR